MEILLKSISGYWTIALVVVVFVIGWYILMIARTAWEARSVSAVFHGMAGWVIAIVFAVCIALPMAGWMFNQVYKQIFKHPIVKTAEDTVAETARFTVDVLDGDGTIAMPSINAPRGEPDDVIIIPNAHTPHPTHPPVYPTAIPVYPTARPPAHHPPQAMPDATATAYQAYLDGYYGGQATPQPVYPTAQPAPPTPMPPTKGGGSQPYVVVSGDTLYKIAAAQLGNSDRWRELCQANFGMDMSRCNNLVVGQTIMIQR